MSISLQKQMLEPIDNQYKQIGHIARSHGVNGQVVIMPEDEFTPQLFDHIDLAHIQQARGELVPARIESVRVQQKNNRLSFFVKFEHITNRNQAEELKGLQVFVPKEQLPQKDTDDEATPDYTSYEVRDEQQTPIGVVTGMLENPAHLILQVDAGTRQLLIPFVDEYVCDTDEVQKTINCQNLDQLTDL